MNSRTVVTNSRGESSVKNVQVDPPEGAQLVLALEGCGLCGTDLFKIDQRQATDRTHSPAPAVVLGHELVGQVVSRGPDCPFALGDRLAVAHHVACGQCSLCRSDAETNCPTYRENLLEPGGFSERVLVHERAVYNSAFKLDSEIRTESGIFLEPTACVLRGLYKADLSSDSSVLVFGCGSMGLLHLLTLRATKPGVAIHMIDPNRSRRETALSLGATTVTDSASPDVKAAEPIDAAFDTVGVPDVVLAAQRRLRPGGTVVLFAHGTTGQSTSVPSNAFFRAEQRVVSTYSSGRQDQIAAYELICGNNFDPGVLVTHRLPLSELDQAIELMRNQNALKVMLTD